jgi:hypothetical protein
MTDHEEAVSRLQQMLRFDTTNPPGNELALVAHLAAELKVEGLEAEVLQAAPERASLAVRLRGVILPLLEKSPTESSTAVGRSTPS